MRETTLDNAKEVWKEEAREDGWEAGMEKGVEAGIKKGILQNRVRGQDDIKNYMYKCADRILCSRPPGASVDEIRKTEKTNLQKRVYTPILMRQAPVLPDPGVHLKRRF